MSRVEAPRRTPWLLGECRRVLAEDGRAFVSGIPALLAGATALALFLYLWTTPEDQVAARYLQQAARRTSAKDYDAALVCYERLIKDSGPQPEILYDQALALQAKGDRGQAESILSRIAPIERPGYLPAHMKLARLLLAGEDRTERTVRVAERHARYALDGPDSVEASALLGQILIGTGRVELAEPYLVRAVGKQPEILIVLARLAHQQGQDLKARQRAEQARSTFKAKTEERVDDPEARLNWATACVFLEDYAGAVAVLERGIRISADPRYNPGIARIYAAWADAKARDPMSEVGARLGLLERGLKHDPANVELLDRLGTVLRKGGPEGERVRSTLQTLIADGKGTPAAHFVLGVAANEQGRAAEARLHWEQAFRLDPRMGVVANNLAWVLAQADPPDLDRALELANLAVDRQPKEATFRGTRGFILMKMKRWSESLTDLEAELAAYPGKEKVHRALAEVYDHLGSSELASRHRDRAAALAKSGAGQGG